MESMGLRGIDINSTLLIIDITKIKASKAISYSEFQNFTFALFILGASTHVCTHTHTHMHTHNHTSCIYIQNKHKHIHKQIHNTHTHLT